MRIEQLFAAGLQIFPCWKSKKPAVKKGESWKDLLGVHPAHVNYPCNIYAVTPPPGIIVIDHDSYKPDAATLEQIEQCLGAPLDWNAALIQVTQSGGRHYAFRCPFPARQGRNIGVTGLDVRVHERGYICSGEGYQWVDAGLFKLVCPESLPELPIVSKTVLGAPERQTAVKEIAKGREDIDRVREALRFIDPACDRPTWIQIGTSLQSYLFEDYDTGLSLFDEWSRGDLWHDGCPDNYNFDDVITNYDSFKEDGANSIRTLFFHARNCGYSDPRDFDVFGAFCDQDAAPVEKFSELIDRIQENGGNPKETTNLIDEIRELSGSLLQRDILCAALKAELKAVGLLDKKLEAILTPDIQKPKVDGPAAAIPDITPLSEVLPRKITAPTNDDGANAQAIVNEVFGNRLLRIAGELRYWNGLYWERVSEGVLRDYALAALSPSNSKKSVVYGTAALVPHCVRNIPAPEPTQEIYFKNCIVDPVTLNTRSHAPENYNTSALDVEYTPGAQSPEFCKFLLDIFGGLDDEADRINFMWEIIGYMLCPHNLGFEKIIAFDGASRAGKGIIAGVILKILGNSRGSTFSFCNMADTKVQPQFITYDVLIDFEAKTPQGREISAAASFLTSVTSNEPVTIPLMYQKGLPYSGRLNCKMLLCCNGIPMLHDSSGATANRYLVANFARTFVDRQDRFLASRLEPECAAIASQAVTALHCLIANGKFTEPASTADVFEDLKKDTQILIEFIDEKFKRDPDTGRAAIADAWKAYKMWASENGHKTYSRRIFYRDLKQTALGIEGVDFKKNVRVPGHDYPVPGFYGIELKVPVL